MTGVRPTNRYQRSPAALWRRVGSGIVVSTQTDPEVHELLGGAVAIWDQLADPRTVTELIEKLAQTHDVRAESIESDIVVVMDTMHRLGIVQEVTT